jgi:hypothetical protein
MEAEEPGNCPLSRGCKGERVEKEAVVYGVAVTDGADEVFYLWW